MPESSGSPIQIFLIAEHAILRQNLGILLEGEGMVLCGWAEEASTAIDAIPVGTDLVIVGLSGRGQGGAEMVRELGSRPGSPPSLVLSSNDDDFSIRQAFAAGARGYVTNREAPRLLAHAIREVVQGRKELPRSLVEQR